jgi:hypothetical protein
MLERAAAAFFQRQSVNLQKLVYGAGTPGGGGSGAWPFACRVAPLTLYGVVGFQTTVCLMVTGRTLTARSAATRSTKGTMVVLIRTMSSSR